MQNKRKMDVKTFEQIFGHKLTVRELVNGYLNVEIGDCVRGFGGLLDIRPEYQRKFIYEDDQQKAVIKTVFKDFPLNVMYWAVNRNDNGDATYEVLDGQQRTLSICEYVYGKDGKGNGLGVNLKGGDTSQTFANLTEDEQNQILDYKLDVYLCEGTEDEKLDWFETINIAGEKLTKQELRNATYHGPWVSSAKAIFSSEKGKGVVLADMNGGLQGKKEPLINDSGDNEWKRQGYLQTAIRWAAETNKEVLEPMIDERKKIKTDALIEAYMQANKDKSSAKDLYEYFEKVITWVRKTFIVYRKEMKGLNWHLLYNQYGDKEYDVDKLENEIAVLMADIEVTNKKAIYEYVLSDRGIDAERGLNTRSFKNNKEMKNIVAAVYHMQGKKCPLCVKNGVMDEHELDKMEADHIKPWSKGGKTEFENCCLLCRDHNKFKSDDESSWLADYMQKLRENREFV